MNLPASAAAYAWISIGAAIATSLLKLLAWKLTASVGLLSDALESLVNLAGAAMALTMIRFAAEPADDEHPYGHSKAEYFSSGFEGVLILVAGAAILVAAALRLLHPHPLEQVGPALVVSGLALAINLVTSRLLGRAGTELDSVALRADSAHLMTDVWTSAGIIAAVALIAVTGWDVIDPLIAAGVGCYILWTGLKLLREALSGLIDVAWPAEDLRTLEQLLGRYRAEGIGFHAIRTRQAAWRRFVSCHVLVPGAWSVKRGHDLLERFESDLAAVLPHVSVLTHLEPIEDAASYEDAEIGQLERPAPPPQ